MQPGDQPGDLFQSISTYDVGREAPSFTMVVQFVDELVRGADERVRTSEHIARRGPDPTGESRGDVASTLGDLDVLNQRIEPRGRRPRLCRLADDANAFVDGRCTPLDSVPVAVVEGA